MTGRAKHLGVRWADAVVCRVEAVPRSGVICPAVYPLPLDGILATAARRATLGASYGHVVDHHTVNLPLARIRQGGTWVWAATCAVFTGQGSDVRWIHQRFDTLEAESVVDRLPAQTDTGRTKAWRIPQDVTTASRITWWCAGDPARIEEILRDVIQIGADRSSGEGTIASWTVTEAGDAAGWVDGMPPRVLTHTADGHPARPFPLRIRLGFGPGSIPHATRPPYWRASLQCAADGTTERRHLEVAAPWS